MKSNKALILFFILHVSLLIISPLYADTKANCGMVDYGGKVYSTVVIGDGCWLAENLDYDNGCTSVTWVPMSDEGWCGYYDDTDYGEGLLYQWSAAMNGSTKRVAQGICPEGWHIPTDEEWRTLELYLWDGEGACERMRISYDCSPAGDMLKTADDCSSGSNCGTTGFKGLLVGSRSFFGLLCNGQDCVGPFFERGMKTVFWSSSMDGADAYMIGLGSGFAGVYRHAGHKAAAVSVRCLKD